MLHHDERPADVTAPGLEPTSIVPRQPVRLRRRTDLETRRPSVHGSCRNRRLPAMPPNRHYECLRHLGGEERDERDQHGRATRSHLTHRRHELQGFNGTGVSRAQHPNRSGLMAARTDRTARTRQ